MAKKTVFKRLSKWVPMSAEAARAVDATDAEPERQADVTSVTTLDFVEPVGEIEEVVTDQPDPQPESTPVSPTLPGLMQTANVTPQQMAAWAKGRSLDLSKPEDIAKIVNNWQAIVDSIRRTQA
jgi:hypothetical protein